MSTRPMIDLCCKMCGSGFSRTKREVDRQVRAGRDPSQFFCSRTCACKWGNGNMSDEQRQKRVLRNRRSQPRATTAAAQRNTKGRFTYYLNKSRHRHNDQWEDTDLTDQFLETLWNHQNGRCAWTGLPMVLTNRPRHNPGLYAASLDRIDSSRGYVQGNVQFVIQALNLAKGNRPNDEFIAFVTHLMNLGNTTRMSD